MFRDFKFGNGLQIACGGSILSNIWVVSASHCFFNCPNDPEEENYDVKEYSIMSKDEVQTIFEEFTSYLKRVLG